MTVLGHGHEDDGLGVLERRALIAMVGDLRRETNRLRDEVAALKRANSHLAAARDARRWWHRG